MELERSNQKNSSIKNGYRAKLDSLAFYVSKINGIKNFNLDDRKFLVLWLEKNLKGISIEEAAKASDMALNGELDIKTELFGTVSCKYMAELIAKYKSFKKEQEKQRMLKTPALPEPKISTQQKTKIIKEEFYRVFEVYKKDKSLPLAAYDVLFNYAWSNGLTRYNKESIQEIKTKAEDIINKDAEVEKGNAKDVIQMKLILDKYSNYVDKSIFKNICKKLYLQKYFDDVIEMQEDIKSLIR